MPKTKVAKPAAREDYDGPWKNFIEAHFPQLITFFVSAAADEIDWTKKPISLNTELRRLRRGNEAGDQRVDALFQVFLKNGDSRYVLVHIEVQSTRDHKLPDRMYEYAYRVWDRHRQRVAGIVILADTGPRFEQPSEFGWELWGTKMAYNFPVIRLLDLAQDRQKLEESSNVFAVATLAQLDAKATREDPEARLDAAVLRTLDPFAGARSPQRFAHGLDHFTHDESFEIGQVRRWGGPGDAVAQDLAEAI